MSAMKVNFSREINFSAKKKKEKRTKSFQIEDKK